jgi:hypothetical protein
MKRIGRLRLARRLQRAARSRGYRPSLRLCYRIVAAARDTKTPIRRLAALVEKESAFKFVFGHDAGGWFPGQRVTRRKYRKLRNHLRKDWSGANGVGYVQATYPAFITNDPGLWRPKHNLRWGAKQLASLIDAHGLEAGMNAYNGDPTGAYGRDLAARSRAYAQALRR